jgi:putative ABC transport system ATP-binding protein
MSSRGTASACSTTTLMRKIVEVRHQFHANLPVELQTHIERYNPNAYLTSGTLVDNIVFGKLNHRFSDAISEAEGDRWGAFQAKRPELYRALMALGLESNIGAGGRRLNSLQRLKLGLARALIRRSDYYIFNRALSGVGPPPPGAHRGGGPCVPGQER